MTTTQESDVPRILGRRRAGPSDGSRRELYLVVAVVMIFVLVGTQDSSFATFRSLNSILTDSVSMGLLAIAVSIVIIGGGIDISIASTLTASAIVAGLVAQHGGPVWLAILAGVTCGALLGFINAVLIVVLGIQPIVATLATMGIFRGLLTQTTKDLAVNDLPLGFLAVGQDKALHVPIPVWIFGAVILGAILLMRYTGIGRLLYAIGNNQAACRRAGMRVDLVIASSYVLCGAVAGLAGVLFAARNATVVAQSGTGLELAAIAAVVVGGVSITGGRGTVHGAAIAAVLIASITAAMVTLGIRAAWQDAGVGATIVVAVVIFALSERSKEEPHV